ncbi:hypothetical protein KUCAC02_025591 [Chaenocephalus aceratus]|uniref:Uncharacterized protein n=1 Tax=Chaenocephalus aceratus TaxID=36190 RepID=A0ACB9VU82_CHAAC|nr:hypothetical protein KUCAC02_025591 [Chaenocephalus aceratus]
MRFLRPVSIYSPVFDRRISRKKLSYADESEGEADESVDHVESGHECEKGDSGEEDIGKDFKTNVDQCSPFVDLPQVYKEVQLSVPGAEVYYKQLCRKCQVGFNPYRLEPILCKDCSQTTCNCEKKLRHINMKRPHRQDLCFRRKGSRLSCDATYSFKYLV